MVYTMRKIIKKQNRNLRQLKIVLTLLEFSVAPVYSSSLSIYVFTKKGIRLITDDRQWLHFFIEGISNTHYH